jgi:methionyl-tRNA formyltransferase
MRIAFYGSSGFSREILQKLFEFHNLNKLELVYVISQSSKEFSRKKIILDNPVVDFCKKNNIKFFTPKSLKVVEELEFINEPIDLSIVAAYGKIIPEALLNSTKYGFINFHGSLLPAYRGATPVQMTILNQDIESCGISIIKMDKGMDTGELINREKLIINRQELLELAAGELMSKLAELSVEILDREFDSLFSPEGWKLTNQDETKATFCYVSDMTKEKMEVRYDDSVDYAHGKIMAANPEPIAWIKLTINEEEFVINLIRSKIDQNIDSLSLTKRNKLGFHFIQKRLFLELKNGFVDVLELQPQGKNKMDAKSFGNGYGKLINS